MVRSTEVAGAQHMYLGGALELVVVLRHAP
jgi:hypothetical protein